MISKLIKRELYVVVHGQSARFRLMKWAILIAGSYGLYRWQGIHVVARVWLALAFLGVALHFFFRYKTRGWRESWGPVKTIVTPFDK